MKPSAASLLLLDCAFLSKAEYLARLKSALDHDTLTHIVTLNAEMIVEAQKNTDFRNAIEKADLKIPDGSSMLWAKKYIEQKQNIFLSLLKHIFSKQQPLTGVDSIFVICKLLEETRGVAYLMGGTDEQAQGTLRALQTKYPELHIQIANEQIQPVPTRGVLFLAYGAPKQTLWIEQNRTLLEQSGIRIAIGIGGAFAMISGTLPRAPKWMRRHHLEWLWRLILEPKRIRRIWNAVVVFPSLISGYPH